MGEDRAGRLRARPVRCPSHPGRVQFWTGPRPKITRSPVCASIVSRAAAISFRSARAPETRAPNAYTRERSPASRGVDQRRRRIRQDSDQLNDAVVRAIPAAMPGVNDGKGTPAPESCRAARGRRTRSSMHLPGDTPRPRCPRRAAARPRRDCATSRRHAHPLRCCRPRIRLAGVRSSLTPLEPRRPPAHGPRFDALPRLHSLRPTRRQG